MKTVILFCFIFVLTFSNTVYAASSDLQTIKQESSVTNNTEQLNNNEEISENKISEEKSTNYSFPFPGILTNHPLFFLKTIRDRILELIVTDPIKKIELSLLQSDKYFAMGLTYVDRKDYKNALEVFNQAVSYKDKTIINLTNAQKANVSVFPSIINSIISSTNKQNEMLTQIQKNISKDTFDPFMTVLEAVKKQEQNLLPLITPKENSLIK